MSLLDDPRLMVGLEAARHLSDVASWDRRTKLFGMPFRLRFKQMTDEQTSNSEDDAKHAETASSKDTRSAFPLPVERTFIHFQIYPTCQRRSSSVPTRGRSGSM